MTTTRRGHRRSLRRRIQLAFPQTVETALLLGGLAAVFVPYAWIVLTAFKRPVDASAIPPRIFAPFSLAGFETLFQVSFAGTVMNSVIMTFLGTVPTLVLGVPAAWAFARARFRLKRVVGGWILFSQLIPPVIFILPMYLLFYNLKLVNTFQGLTLAYVSGLLPFTIWVMSGYFADIPEELQDAARIDGCTRFQAFYKVELPLAVPGIASVGILVAILAWNEYFGALILGGQDTYPATVGLASYVGMENVNFGPLGAGALILVGPIFVLTLLAQRRLLRGLTAGAIKG